MQPGSLWQPTPNSGGGRIIVISLVGSAVLHTVLFLLPLPEPKVPEVRPNQQVVMVTRQAPKPRPPEPKQKPEPKKEPPKTFSREPSRKSQPQKAKASRPILSSKAVSTDAGSVSENQLAGSRGTGYGTEKGNDLGSTNPQGVDNGGGSPEPVAAAPPPPPPPPAPLVNAKPRGAVQPEYPEIAQQNNWEGRVVVKAYINADGSVGEVQVAKSSGHSELDEAALAAVKRTKFEPAKRGDEVVAAWVRVPVTFALQ